MFLQILYLQYFDGGEFMNCISCPYIKDELKLLLKYTDDIESAISSCWCDKLGHRIYDFSCETNEENKNHLQIVNDRKRERTNRYQKKQNYKKRIKTLNERNLRYPGAVMYVDKERIYKNKKGYVFVTKPYYKRIFKGKQWTESKRIGNKIVRHQKGTIYNHRSYKKVYNVWNNYI